MKLLVVIALLLQLPAQRPGPQDAPLSPAQLIEYHRKVETEAQRVHGEIQPGATVKVFMRSEQEWMVLVRSKTGGLVVYLMDVRLAVSQPAANSSSERPGSQRLGRMGHEKRE